MALVATIPVWLTGKNISAVSIEPLTYDTATGTLTSTTAVSLVGLVDEITVNESVRSEMIAPITSSYDNEIAIENDFSVTLAEILQRPANSSILAAAWQNAQSPIAEYARVIVTRGGNTWTFVGLMTGYTETIAKGKCVSRLTLVQVDVGNANSDPVLS